MFKMSTTVISTSEKTTGRSDAAESKYSVNSLGDFLADYFQGNARSVAFHIDENTYLADFYHHLSEDCPQIKCLNVPSGKFASLNDKFGMLDNCLAFQSADLDLVVSVVFANQDIKNKFETDFDNFQRVFKTMLFNLIKFNFHKKTVQFANSTDLISHHQITEKYRNFVEIARGIMHSFNNHLALIMGRTQLLSMFSGEMIEKKAAQKGLDIILKATNAASDQISILQSYVRMDADKKSNQIPVGALVDEIMELSTPRWKGMGHGAITFEYRIDPNLTFMGNRKKIKEVLINVLMNAVESEMEKGGVIEINAIQKNSQIIISVKAHGEGIPASNLEMVFDPLFTTKINGTGLGLYIAREFLKENRGKIDLHSTTGMGTTVNIYLPLN